MSALNVRSCLQRLLPAYPDIKVEIVIDYGLTDIAADGLDVGIRIDEMVAKDMIAVRIGPDLRSAVVGAPSYFANRPKPRTPQDLTAYACVNLRLLPTHGGLYAWEFEKKGREIRVRVDGMVKPAYVQSITFGLEPKQASRDCG